MGQRSPVVAPSCCVQKQDLGLSRFYVPANSMTESGAPHGWEETSSLFYVGLAGQCKYFSRLLEHSPIVQLPETKPQRITFA